MSVRTPILMVVCCASAVPHISAVASAAAASVFLIMLFPLLSLLVSERQRGEPLARPFLKSLAAHQRAARVLQRTECFRRRDRLNELVEVAGILRLGGLLHLEQIGVVNLAAVRLDRTLAEQRVVRRQF